MLILIVILPLFGFFSGSIFGKFLGWGACYTTILFTYLSFFLSTILFYNIIFNSSFYKVVLSSWIVVDSLNIKWSFRYDSLTSILLLVVTFISTIVHVYSTEYMEHDPHLPRFMSYLSLFTFFMLILITANNFLQMFVGWEGVGLSSYLLINFWFTRIQANKAAIKAMLVNRIGDFALLLAIFTIYFIFNTLDYDIIFCLVPLAIKYQIWVGGFTFSIIDTICILLFIGCMGKSAQLGLHTWLPDAMEGPTPVSALIHAATMVTAGVFLITRCSFLFEFSTLTLNLIVFIGSTTSFFAATTGLFQNDIKKVIAYSTCSQLGYMIFACGLSSYEVAIFHLSNHAFFKALLFLGAGSIIHSMSDEQDMRRMGGLRKLLPFSYAIMLVGSLALMGFPFLSGFYSKDIILEIASIKYTNFGQLSAILGTLSAFCTAFYSIRLLFLVFLSETNSNRSTTFNAHEGSWRITVSLLILSFFSVVIGYSSQDFFSGFGTNFWRMSIFILPQNYSLASNEFLDVGSKLIPLIFTFWGVSSAYLYFFNLTDLYNNIKKHKNFKVLYSFLNKKWYFDRIYNEFIGQNIFQLSYKYSYKDLDRGLVEKIGPSGIINMIKDIMESTIIIQSGYISHYLFLMILSLISWFLFVLFFFNFFIFFEIIILFLFLIFFFHPLITI